MLALEFIVSLSPDARIVIGQQTGMQLLRAPDGIRASQL
jgi:hypothetical protein